MKVSVWVGNTPSWNAIDGHLTFNYTEDGDAVPCRFCNAFGFDWFDEDFREASCSENESFGVRDLLTAHHTRGTEIVVALGAKALDNLAFNAAVLLLNFEYSGNIESAHIGGDTFLRFLGCVDVDP